MVDFEAKLAKCREMEANQAGKVYFEAKMGQNEGKWRQIRPERWILRPNEAK